jgi:hypothetical protein
MDPGYLMTTRAILELLRSGRSISAEKVAEEAGT